MERRISLKNNNYYPLEKYQASNINFEMTTSIKGEKGEYLLTNQVIGQGGVCTVYQGFKLEGGRQTTKVAIKKVSKQTCYGGVNQSYDQELEITKKIIEIERKEPCQYIINILDIYLGVDYYYIITQYYQFGDFLEFMNNKHEFFSYEIVIDILIQIIKAISYLHQHSIIHRDIKPENILIAMEDNFYFIKLADFGTATLRGQQLNGGTLNYLAPEILNKGSQTEMIDIWSFGCLAYEIITKEQLFNGSSYQEVARQILNYQESIYKNQDEEDNYFKIHKIIKKYCLQKDLTKRKNAKFIESKLIYLKQQYYDELKESEYELLKSNEVIFQSKELEKPDVQIQKHDLKNLISSFVGERSGIQHSQVSNNSQKDKKELQTIHENQSEIDDEYLFDSVVKVESNVENNHHQENELNSINKEQGLIDEIQAKDEIKESQQTEGNSLEQSQSNDQDKKDRNFSQNITDDNNQKDTHAISIENKGNHQSYQDLVNDQSQVNQTCDQVGDLSQKIVEFKQEDSIQNTCLQSGDFQGLSDINSTSQKGNNCYYRQQLFHSDDSLDNLDLNSSSQNINSENENEEAENNRKNNCNQEEEYQDTCSQNDNSDKKQNINVKSGNDNLEIEKNKLDESKIRNINKSYQDSKTIDLRSIIESEDNQKSISNINNLNNYPFQNRKVSPSNLKDQEQQYNLFPQQNKENPTNNKIRICLLLAPYIALGITSIKKFL